MGREPCKKPEKRALESQLFVALGASAGGLEPLEQFFAHLPANAGLSFVVVQHLEPHRPSLLADLLARHASVPVAEAVDGVQPQADHVYVIAPGTLLTLEAGAFRVTPATEPTSHGPIDVFFHSLATEKGERAVAIVFSGAGQDGTAGLRAIKERGGLTLAQAPDTAKHPSMPQTAIEASLVDHVLPPEQLAMKLLEHAGYVTTAEKAGTAALEPVIASNLGRICTLIRQRTGHDFASYKEGTLLRRIRRRMQILHTSAVDDYLQQLEKDPGEADALVTDLLIGVTQFFRDPGAFQALAQQVIPRVVQGRTPDAPIRIWVAGCASGEEAYSIAILVREHLERLGAKRLVQIFATDLDAEMLVEARQGRYPLSIAEHLGPGRLARFFERQGESYQAGKELRELCIFSQQSVIRDPPFSQLDLISCRNLLIYLSAELQKKLVPLFHYALRPGGFLFLGPSEGVAGSPELFETTDKRNRIFRRKETVVRPVVDFPLSACSPARPIMPPPAIPVREGPPSTLQRRANAAFERMTLDDYAPPSVVVNDRSEIVFVAGKTGRFFQPPSGVPSSNIIDVAPPSLRTELRLALQAASASQRRVVRENVMVELEDGIHRVRLTVRPLPGIEHEAGLLAVVVQEHAPLDRPEEAEPLASSAEQPAMERLEGELRATRAQLETTVENLESANEELKSSNEELISTNEELQSANEELQTSKEELQSLNEELETVNTELRQKVEELGTANSDLSNLFASTEVATLFLDRQLRVARFTPAATELFHLREGDVGRPIADFAPRFDGQDVIADAREALRTLKPVERQVRTGDEKAWFILRVLPYRTMENVIAGVVVTFVDVTELKRAEEALRQSEERFRVAQDLSPDGFLIYRPLRDGTGVVTDFLWIYENGAAARMNDTNPKEVRGKRVSEVLPHHHKSPFHKAYKEVAETGEVRVVEEAFYDQDTFRQRRWFRVAAVPTAGRDVAILVQDVTARKSAEEALVRANERERFLAEVLENATTPFGIGAADGRLVLFNHAFAELTGYSREEIEDRSLSWVTDLTPPEWREKEAETLARAVRNREPVRYEKEYLRKDGSRVPIELSVQPVFAKDGTLVHFRSFLADITERKRAQEVQARLAAIVESSDDAILSKDLTGTILTWNQGAERMFGYSAEEAIGRTVAMLIPEERLQEEDRIIERIAAGDHVDHYETERITKDGVRRVVWISVSPLVGSDGKVIGASKILRDVTDRKRYEESVQAHRRLLETVMDHVPAAVNLIRGSDLRLQLINSAYQAIAPGKDMVGKTLDELWPETGQQFGELCRKVLETGETYHVEDELNTIRRQPDGPLEKAYFSWSLHRVPLPGGEGWGVLNTSWETTGRKRVEEALRRNEKTFSELVERAPFGIYVVDSQLRIAHMNAGSQAGAFRNVRPVIGRPLNEAMHTLWPDAVAEEIIGHFHHTLETGEPYSSPRFTNRRADVGIVESYVWELHRIVLPDGQNGIICYYFDSTELRTAEQAVRRSREGLSRLAKASLSVMAKTDLEAMLQAIAEAAIALTGARISICGHGRMGGRPIVVGSAHAPGAPACPPGNMFQLDEGGVHMALVEAAESIRLDDEQLRAHAKGWGLPEGHAPMRGLLGVPMRGRSDRGSGMILVTDKEHGDFTEEDESLLKQLGTVASLAIQHVEARISLEEADKRKNEFLAMLSHELRNPLAPIRNSLYILDRAPPEGEQARRARSIIDRQATHLTHLVDDLLDVTRITRGKVQLHRESIDFADVVRRAVEDHRSDFAVNRLELEVAIPGRTLIIDGDRTRIAQVIGNILQNAAKFTPAGGKVVVSVDADEALGQAIARVRDTGPGIAPEMLPRIFEPFTQADTTLDRSKGGLGLGLALVKGLVEMHGGAASVESEGLGRGAEFTIRLPLKVELALEAPRPLPARGDGATRRVLVIEDNVDAAQSLREVLELCGHTVEVAFSGPEGLEKAQSFRPEVLLCDIGLPEMDGYQVARAIRADPALATAELVALTGYAAPEDVAKAKDAGFDAHLAKPPSHEALERVLTEGPQSAFEGGLGAL